MVAPAAPRRGMRSERGATDRARTERAHETPAREQERQRSGPRQASRAVRLVEDHAVHRARRVRGQRDEGEDLGEPEPVGTEVREQRARQEGRTEVETTVRVEEVAPVLVELRPHLRRHRQPERRSELRPRDRAVDHQRDERGREQPAPPSSVLVTDASGADVRRGEEHGDHAGPPRRAAVQHRAEHQHAEEHDTARRGSLEHAEQRAQRADDERDAPREVFVVDPRQRGQVHDHRAAEHGADERTDRDGLATGDRGIAAHEDPHAPHEDREEERGHEPREEHRRRGQLPVERVRHREDRHAQDRRERPEVEVVVAVDDECLDAEAVLRNRPRAVEERARLGLVKVGERAVGEGGAQRIEPATPQHPQVRDRCEADTPEGRAGEPTTIRGGAVEVDAVLGDLVDARRDVRDVGRRVDEGHPGECTRRDDGNLGSTDVARGAPSVARTASDRLLGEVVDGDAVDGARGEVRLDPRRDLGGGSARAAGAAEPSTKPSARAPEPSTSTSTSTEGAGTAGDEVVDVAVGDVAPGTRRASGAGSLPLKPPIAMIGSPDASW